MRFEQPPAQKLNYIVTGEDLKNVELNRDDVLEEAALILDNDREFPDPRGERADHLRAKRAIRDVIKKHGTPTNLDEKQIDIDANEVLDLFKKK